MIDLQNDITKNYREIIDTINQAIDRAVSNDITEFFIAEADATACIKSTCYNMSKAGYTVHVLSDCITSYDKNKLYKLADGTYMDRIDRHFTYNGTDTWTDENGAEWNEVAKD